MPRPRIQRPKTQQHRSLSYYLPNHLIDYVKKVARQNSPSRKERMSASGALRMIIEEHRDAR